MYYSTTQVCRCNEETRTNSNETSLIGQPLFDTETNTLYIGDGETKIKELQPITNLNAGIGMTINGGSVSLNQGTQTNAGGIKIWGDGKDIWYNSGNGDYKVEKNTVYTPGYPCTIRTNYTFSGTCTNEATQIGAGGAQFDVDLVQTGVITNTEYIPRHTSVIINMFGTYYEASQSRPTAYAEWLGNSYISIVDGHSVRIDDVTYGPPYGPGSAVNSGGATFDEENSRINVTASFRIDNFDYDGGALPQLSVEANVNWTEGYPVISGYYYGTDGAKTFRSNGNTFENATISIYSRSPTGAVLGTAEITNRYSGGCDYIISNVRYSRDASVSVRVNIENITTYSTYYTCTDNNPLRYGSSERVISGSETGSIVDGSVYISSGRIYATLCSPTQSYVSGNASTNYTYTVPGHYNYYYKINLNGQSLASRCNKINIDGIEYRSE